MHNMCQVWCPVDIIFSTQNSGRHIAGTQKSTCGLADRKFWKIGTRQHISVNVSYMLNSNLESLLFRILQNGLRSI